MAKAPRPIRHLVVPDTQIRPGVPQDHLDWIGKALVEYKPDVIVHVGDHWDMASLNGHEEPGSAPMEGRRFADDIASGNAAFARMCVPMEREIKRLAHGHRSRWKPRKVFLMGNHENRADRCASNNPKWLGTIGSDQCDTRDWERHRFLEVVHIDGVAYSHYFQSSHSDRPVGGEISNRLSKIGCSFVQGHEQGRREGNKIMGSGKTLHGLVCGSAYLHVEEYRGAQGQRHWRGIIALNSVEDGEYDIMPMSLKYLCWKYTGMRLFDYMVKHYPGGDWVHLK